jgi:uncharacterized protein (TIGR00288 family)
MTTGKSVADSQIAVLIDFENVGLGAIEGLFDALSDVGRIIIKRAYADWSSSKAPREQLFKLGIEPVLIYRPPKSGKNASDIRLTIDATELLFQSNVDTFVIVSSDTDFIPLINKLRSTGKMVIGAGPKNTGAKSLVRACDRYFFLDQPGFGAPDRLPEVSPIDELILRAFRASADENGQVRGSKLYETMQRLDPSFNYRSFGHSTFVKLLGASPVVKLTRSRKVSDVIIELAEPFESSLK